MKVTITKKFFFTKKELVEKLMGSFEIFENGVSARKIGKLITKEHLATYGNAWVEGVIEYGETSEDAIDNAHAVLEMIAEELRLKLFPDGTQ